MLKSKIIENYVILSMISGYFYIVLTGNYDLIQIFILNHLNAMNPCAIISRFISFWEKKQNKTKIYFNWNQNCALYY